MLHISKWPCSLVVCSPVILLTICWPFCWPSKWYPYYLQTHILHISGYMIPVTITPVTKYICSIVIVQKLAIKSRWSISKRLVYFFTCVWLFLTCVLSFQPLFFIYSLYIMSFLFYFPFEFDHLTFLSSFHHRILNLIQNRIQLKIRNHRWTRGRRTCWSNWWEW